MATLNGWSSKNGYGFWLEISEYIEYDQNNEHYYITSNQTRVDFALKIQNHGSRTDSSGWTLAVNINGDNVVYNSSYHVDTYKNKTAGFYDTFTLASGSVWVTHETNGSKSISCSASLSKNSGYYADYEPGACGVNSQSVQLTTIPRYTSITGYTLSAVDERTINVAWSASDACDSVQYKIIGISSDWVNASGTSFNITHINNNTRLSAGTRYTIRIRVKRSTSQLWTESSDKPVTTISWPYIKGTLSSFIIGNDFTVTLENPLQRTCTIKLIADNNSEKSKPSTTGTSVSGFNDENDGWLTFLNNSIPNNVKGKYRINLTCFYDEETRVNSTTSAYDYFIPTNPDNTYDSSYKPVFTDSNITSVSNTDLETINISGVNKFIKGHNQLTVVFNPMSAQKGSSGNYYDISSAGVQTQREQYSNSSISVSIDDLISDNFKITAFDTRNIYTEIVKNIDLINYSNPIINENNIDIKRQNIIGDKAVININGNYTNWSDLLQNNVIQSIKYRIGSSGNFSDLPSGSSITYQNGNWSLSTILNDTFNVRSTYQLYFEVTDLLESSVFGPYTLSTADAFVWKDLEHRYIGINKKPECELDVNGAAKFSKTSYNYNGGALVGSKLSSQHTIPNLINELKYTNGQMGSFELTSAYTLNGKTVGVGWYNYTWIPHRSGGNSGQSYDDNCSFGSLFLSGMCYNINGPYLIHYDVDQITSIQKLSSVEGYDALPLGSIIEYPHARTSLPAGWMICDGTAISRTDYSELFNLIGTTYGSGNGSTTFNLPNLKGRVVVGGDASQTEFNALGLTGGEKTHTLTVDEMPAHKHSSNYNTAYDTGTTGWGSQIVQSQTYTFGITNMSNIMQNTGKGYAHNNLQPYIVLNYIIKVSNTSPVAAGSIIDNLNGSSHVDAPSINAVKNALGNSFISTGSNEYGTYIKFGSTSGFMICYGRTNSKNIASGSSGEWQITLPQSYANANYSIFLTKKDGGAYFAQATERSAPGSVNKFTIYSWNDGGGTAQSVGYDWMTIGSWSS